MKITANDNENHWLSLIEEMQQRILTLELGLKELSAQGLLSDYAFQKRSDSLLKLKAKLNSLQAATAKMSQKSPHDWQHLLPQANRLTPIERKILASYFSDQIALFKLCLKMNTQVIKSSKSMIKSRFKVFDIFSFAKLKKVLVQCDQLLKLSELKKQQMNHLAEVIITSMQKKSEKLPLGVKSLIALFDRLEDHFNDSIQNRAKLHKKHAENQWAKMWLNIQEKKMFD